jgi:phosphoketolase
MGMNAHANGGVLLREHAPELKVRVINVVDLLTLQPPEP